MKRKRIYLLVGISVLVLATIVIVVLNFTNKPNTTEPNGNTTQQSNSSDADGNSQNVQYGDNPYQDNTETSTVITNYDNVVQNLPTSEKDTIQDELVATLSLNNVNNKVDDVVIRDGTYSQSIIDTDLMIYQTTFIIDIPSIRQTYYIENLYSPLPVNQSKLYDYTTLVLCPSSDQMIYGPFNCIDRISMERNGQ